MTVNWKSVGVQGAVVAAVGGLIVAVVTFVLPRVFPEKRDATTDNNNGVQNNNSGKGAQFNNNGTGTQNNYLSSNPPPQTDAEGNPIGLLHPAHNTLPLQGFYRLIDRMGNVDVNTTCFLVTGACAVGLENAWKYPEVVPVISFHRKPLVTLSIGPEGAAISGEFRNHDQNTVALMESNHFVLDKANYWRSKVSDDGSDLAIMNHKNEMILNFWFCNSNCVAVLGDFVFPDGTTVTMTQKFCLYEGSTNAGNISIGMAGMDVTAPGSLSFGGGY